MTLFYEATEINNLGVQSLLDSDTESAVDLMVQAIKLMRADISEADFSGVEAEQGVENGLKRIQTVEVTSIALSETIAFNQAIRFPLPGELGTLTKNVFTSAAVYNYALANQLKASTHPEEAVHCLEKAEKLYSMALQLLSYRSMTSHDAIIVKLACINNLTQIRYARGNFEGAREGLTQVAQFVNTFAYRAMFDVPEIHGLIVGGLLLGAPIVANAA